MVKKPLGGRGEYFDCIDAVGFKTPIGVSKSNLPMKNPIYSFVNINPHLYFLCIRYLCKFMFRQMFKRARTVSSTFQDFMGHHNHSISVDTKITAQSLANKLLSILWHNRLP